MFRFLPLILLGLALPAQAARTGEKAKERPAVDRDAMEDAMADRGSERFASPSAYEHYLRARLAEVAGDLPLALEEMKQAAAFDLDSPAIRLALGTLYAELGDRELATVELSRALRALDLTPDLNLRASVEEELRMLGRATAAAPELLVPVYEAGGVD